MERDEWYFCVNCIDKTRQEEYYLILHGSDISREKQVLDTKLNPMFLLEKNMKWRIILFLFSVVAIWVIFIVREIEIGFLDC